MRVRANAGLQDFSPSGNRVAEPGLPRPVVQAFVELTICGEGEFIKTFLVAGQLRTAKKSNEVLAL
jgi:hypothetical protein